MPTSVSTLTELFLKAASYNKPDCLMSKIGGSYQPISTAELVDRVRRLSKALLELGVERGDRVALMSENGPHWPTVDFATLCAGAVLVPVYPTLLPDHSCAQESRRLNRAPNVSRSARSSAISERTVCSEHRPP